MNASKEFTVSVTGTICRQGAKGTSDLTFEIETQHEEGVSPLDALNILECIIECCREQMKASASELLKELNLMPLPMTEEVQAG